MWTEGSFPADDEGLPLPTGKQRGRPDPGSRASSQTVRGLVRPTRHSHAFLNGSVGRRTDAQVFLLRRWPLSGP